jgi:hypothetical protein
MTKTNLRATCELCDWEGNARGKAGHVRLKHGVTNSQETGEAGLKKSTEEVLKKSNVEVSKMSDFCPECLKKDIAIKDAEKDHKTETEKLTAAVQTAQSRAEDLAKELKSAREAPVEETKNQMPSVDEFVEHCKTCDTHKPQLRQFMDKVMGAMSPDEVKAQMKRLGIEESPDRIILTGLGERELRR